MGHSSAKDIYRKLGKKIDGSYARAPWNKTLYLLLKELYTAEEAEVLVKMPYGLSTFEQIVKVTRIEEAKLHRVLDGCCEKGLVFDVSLNNRYYYILAPMVVGIFEMTMMRTRGELKYSEWANLFNQYMHGSDAFYAANFAHGEKISPLRAMPHEETIDNSSFVEILDYEKAGSIIENSNRFAIGLCSCRHEKLHTGEKKCNVPLDTCSSFVPNADLLISHGLAHDVSKSEMLENLSRSKELGLVLTADNVKKEVGFLCHCCGCCCNVLLGVSKHGYPNTIVTSTFIVDVNAEECSGCGKCVSACPINAISLVDDVKPNGRKGKRSKIDESICLGCGVCSLSCKTKAVRLVKRKERVLHPENTFQRVILQCLERGTLQNQLFNEPDNISHIFLRGMIGGFLSIPGVKQSLMSDQLRSRFLNFMETAARKKRMSV